MKVVRVGIPYLPALGNYILQGGGNKNKKKGKPLAPSLYI